MPRCNWILWPQDDDSEGLIDSIADKVEERVLDSLDGIQKSLAGLHSIMEAQAATTKTSHGAQGASHDSATRNVDATRKEAHVNITGRVRAGWNGASKIGRVVSRTEV